MSDLDPKLTFDSFVVGPANRLASAAARRAADSPGTSYNPLFLYSAPGLGKTHILTAIAHQSAKGEAKKVEYMALEEYLERLEGSLQAGQGDGVYGELDILLLDDVQFLTGQPEAQEMLLKTLDQLSTAGGQIVLASDRPPADIDGLDARLLSRFSGGLIVDLGPPEYETRVAIILRKSEERGQTLEDGVAEAVAKAPFKNVRELGGVLNKIFATQELEGRQVSSSEVTKLLQQQDQVAALGGGSDEFGSFLTELASSVAVVVESKEEPWRKAIREAIESADRQGFLVHRLESQFGETEPKGWEKLVATFKADLQRLREIDNELERLGNPWPEAAQGVLMDPDRLEEGEALLASVRERQRPFPRLGDGPLLHDLSGFEAIALKAAAQFVGEEKPEYNPLFMWSGNERVALTLLAAVGRTYKESFPDQRMAVASVAHFAEDFIRALAEGVAGAWRERWWTVDLLLVHGIQELSETERAQDEFFHLYEALKRRGARMMLVANRAPSSVESIDERLRSRFEGGLVLELTSGQAVDLELVEHAAAAAEEGIFVPDLEAETKKGPDTGTMEPVPAALPEPPSKGGAWFPGPENVVIHWPRIEELLIEELD
ncbi:MAG: DnaA/Hda family protein [Gemmatimonadota bacterium]|nr:DnaA/Hda family protein [Gemmatimonadota bacterium]MDH3421428.1 DnaA/Hda family protein [Gemmatimonadota bacterium]